MSYGIMGYRVNLQKWKSVFGELPDNHKEEALKILSEGMSRLDDNFPEEEGWLPGLVILKQLLNGDFTQAENCAKHWYVVEQLTSILGRRLANSHWYPCSFEDTDVFQNGGSLYGAKTAYALPIEEPDDFPVVWIVEPENLLQLRDSAKSLDKEPQAELLNWIDSALVLKEGLILFYY